MAAMLVSTGYVCVKDSCLMQELHAYYKKQRKEKSYCKVQPDDLDSRLRCR